mgnify:CR=1 FL=1
MAEIKIKADSNGGTVSLKGPATTTGDAAIQLTLPVDDGTANQYLKTDGSGALSWSTVTDTTVGGATGADFNDNVKVRLGTGNDLEIYHDGSHSYIHNNTGELKIRSANFKVVNEGNSEIQIEATENGAVELNYDNVTKLETTSSGASVTGSLGIGTTSPEEEVTIVSSNPCVRLNDTSGCYHRIVSSSNSLYLESDTGDELSGSFIGFRVDNSEHFRIAANGDLTGTDTSISSNSDSRLKKDLADYSYNLSTFKQFQPKTFKWINPKAHNDKHQRGFVAQEIKTIDPYFTSAITIDKNSPDVSLLNTDNVANTTKLGEKDAMYVSVIQQLITKIETLETKVAALEAG